MPDTTFSQTKTDTEPWAGGSTVNLKKKIRGKGVLKDVLAGDIRHILNRELQNQAKLIKKLEVWNRQYRGKKKPKSYPHEGCSNLAIPLTRWLTDTVLVRVVDAIFSQVKVWVLRALEPEWVDVVPELEDGLDWWQKWIANFRKTIFSPLLQCMKTGTGVIKLDYERRKRTIVRRATPEEIRSKQIKKYRASNGELLVKVPQTVYDGPVLKAINRKDFVISSDARTIQDAFLVGFKTRLPKPVVEMRKRTKFYTLTADELDTLLIGDELDETEVKRIEDANKEYQEEQDMVEIWELWLRYDVDGDGEPDDIVVTYNQRTGIILRAIYNPFFYGFRPFKELVFNPVEYSFDGEGLCQILEHLQEEIDTVHNQRIDRMNIINAPPMKRRAGSLCKNIEYVKPGQIVDMDEMDDLEEFGLSEVYPSTWQEEALINQYAQQAVGVTQHVMGQSTAERPVARDTLALIQEANKKFKFGIDNIRQDIEEIGIMVLEMFAQFSPTLSYKTEEEGGFDTKAVSFPAGYIRDGVKVDLMASSEVLNTEVRREIDLTLYQLLKDYSTSVAGALNMFPMVNPALQLFIIEDLVISSTIMRRIVKDFGNVDAEHLVPDPTKHPMIKQLLEQIMQNPGAFQPQMEEGMERGGETGQQGQNIPPAVA